MDAEGDQVNIFSYKSVVWTTDMASTLLQSIPVGVTIENTP